MKALFIWHKNSYQYIEQILTFTSQFDETRFIYTEEEYLKYLSNEFTKGTNSSLDKKSKSLLKYIYLLNLVGEIHPYLKDIKLDMI